MRKEVKMIINGKEIEKGYEVMGYYENKPIYRIWTRIDNRDAGSVEYWSGCSASAIQNVFLHAKAYDEYDGRNKTKQHRIH